VDNGVTGNANVAYVAAGGSLADYDVKTVVIVDPDGIEADYVDVSGGKGVTIAAGFMDNSDEIWYVAIEADRDVDHGDINA